MNDEDETANSGPVWMYRPGESRLFDSPADIPEGEGWVDTPQPGPEPDAEPEKRRRGRPRKNAEENGDDDDAGL